MEKIHTMKRFILLLGFLLLGVGTSSQQHYQQQDARTYIPWTIESPNEWGSFYWSITQHREGNRYIYQVYLYSNSYFQTKRDGYTNDKATTYIRNLNVVMREVEGRSGRIYNSVPIHVAVATADYVLGRPVAHFWSNSNQNRFQITFEACSPFDYSRY